MFDEWRVSVQQCDNEFSFPDSDSDESLSPEEFEKVEYTQATRDDWQHIKVEEMCEELNLPIDTLLVDRVYE